ncbi:hypothetical protein C8Q74DRAFT_1365126 [Fomes fomentarius]|nr:hypothetical protein C8Q74DRAFT_1365126 [Fomes fomentarius]
MDSHEMMIFTFFGVGLIVLFGAYYVKKAQELARERETMNPKEDALTTSPPDPSVSPPIQATLEVTEDLTVSSVPPAETAATPVKRRSRVHVSVTLPKVNVANALSSATRRCSLSKLVHVPTLRNQSKTTKERSKSAREPVHTPIVEVSEDDLLKVAEEKTSVSRPGEEDTVVLESTLVSTTTTTSSRGPVPVKPTVRPHPEVQVTTMESTSSSSYSSPSTSPPLSSPSLSPSSSSAALPSRNPTPWPSPNSSPRTPSRGLQSAGQTPRQTQKLDTSPADTVKATDLKQPRRKHLFRRVMRNAAGEPLRHPNGELQRMARPACAENSLPGVVFKQWYENPFKLLIRSGSKDRAQDGGDAQPSTVPPTSTRTGSSDTPTAPRTTAATATPKAAGGVEALPKDSGLRAAFRLSFSFAAIKSSSSVDVSRESVGPYSGVPMSATSTDASYSTASEGSSSSSSSSWPPSPDDSSDSNASESTSIFSLQSLSTKASSVFSGRGSSSSLKSDPGLVTVAPRPTSEATSTGDGGADANAASCPSDAGMGCTNTADRGLRLVTPDVDPFGVVPS